MAKFSLNLIKETVANSPLSKIFSKKNIKSFMVLLIVIASAAALSGSTYVSYKKAKIKKERIAAAKLAPKKEVPKKIVPIDRKHMKTLSLYGDYGRQNPFSPNAAPVGELPPLSNDYLTPPPQGDIMDSEAGAITGTTVSGIMYDDVNPSAIININGVEYFVKRNDVVNDYKVLSISPQTVVVKYGKNIYRAGVGGLLTDVSSNSNIANLNNKFGGNIAINVRKR